MNSGAILRVASTLRGRIQSRGIHLTNVSHKAVKNFKRPTMDEYGVPTESWAVANARNQKKYSSVLAAGTAFFAVTMAYCWQSDKTVFNTIPRHLIDVPKKNQ